MKLQYQNKYKLGNYNPNTVKKTEKEINGVYYTQNNMCRVYSCYLKSTGWHVGVSVYKNGYDNSFSFKSNNEPTVRGILLLVTKYSKIVNSDPFYSEQTIEPVLLPIKKFEYNKPLWWEFWK